MAVGSKDGSAVGSKDGSGVGSKDGSMVTGASVGDVGARVGLREGLRVGFLTPSFGVKAKIINRTTKDIFIPSDTNY